MTSAYMPLPKFKQTAKWFHKAVEIFYLPPIGKDNNVDGLVARGDLIVVDTFVKNGDIMRLAKSKGVTYRRTEPKPKRIGFLRRQARRLTP